MKSKYLLLIAVTTCCFGLQSCRKYVEVEQYNRRELKYTTDFEYLLNNTTVFGNTYSTPVLTGDDLVFSTTAYQQQQIEAVAWPYTWDADFVAADLEDLSWSRAYKQIYVANEVIAGVMESVDGTEQQKNALLAEAKVQRAYNYFMLANLYGAIYDPATASQAIGVPLLLAPDLYASLERAPLSTVYAQILKDLLEALPNLPTTATNKRHPDKAAVHAILAIVHLHMRNFTEARNSADAALHANTDVLDLKQFANSTQGYPLPFANPETYLSKIVEQNYNEELNPELLALYDATDLRKTVYMQAGTPQMPVGALRSRKANVLQISNGGIDAGPSVPEMLLIKAEVDAREGNVAAAMLSVNTLRRNRFKTEDYVDLTASNAAEALQIVVEERRREFFVSGRRWFDMRRFNLDPSLAKVYRRTFNDVEHVLEVNSNRYIYPVANRYLQFNPEIGQSPR